MLVTSDVSISFDVFILPPLFQTSLLSSWRARLKGRSIAMFLSHSIHTMPYAVPRWDKGLRDELSQSFGHVLTSITQAPAETVAWPPHMATSLSARALGRAGHTLTHIYNWLHTDTHFPPFYVSSGGYLPASNNTAQLLVKPYGGLSSFKMYKHCDICSCAAMIWRIVTSKTCSAVLLDQSVIS